MIKLSYLSIYTPPDGFNIFGLHVKFYGLIIGMAVLIAIFIARALCKYRNLPKDLPFDLALAAVPIGIIGARLFHVLSHISEYDFISALQIWNGGLAIFGGVACGAAGILIYCLIKKVNFFKAADITVPCLLLAQGIGRWGNYFNQELYGPKVNFNFWPISVWIEENQAFHVGMFFIESVWDIGGFFLLYFLLKKLKKPGVVASAYFAWYGFGRFFTEWFRTESVMVGSIGVWQIVSIISFVLGIAGIIYFSLRKNYSKEIKA